MVGDWMRSSWHWRPLDVARWKQPRKSAWRNLEASLGGNRNRDEKGHINNWSAFQIKWNAAWVIFSTKFLFRNRWKWPRRKKLYYISLKANWSHFGGAAGWAGDGAGGETAVSGGPICHRHLTAVFVNTHLISSSSSGQQLGFHGIHLPGSVWVTEF